MSLLTLTTDSDARKRIPLIGGLWGYFAAALVGVAQHSFKSNAKHNKDAPLHWSMDKSTDHAECIGRHVVDLQELIALYEHGGYTPGETATEEVITSIIDEANACAWRALALAQTLHMRFRGAPMPFNARLTADGAPPKRDYLGRPITDDEERAAARRATAADLAGYPPAVWVNEVVDMSKFDGLVDGDVFEVDLGYPVPQLRHVSHNGKVFVTADAPAFAEVGISTDPVYPKHFVRYLTKVAR